MHVSRWRASPRLVPSRCLQPSMPMSFPNLDLYLMRHKCRFLTALVLTMVVGCTRRENAGPAAADSAAGAITSSALLQHIKDLSADSMEGRAPGTPGEQKAVAYMQSQFKALGLKPGNPDDSYL